MSLKSMSHGQCHSIAPNVFHSTASNVIQLTVSNVNDMLSTNKSMPVKSMDMINITTFSLGVDITDVRVTPLEFLTPNNGGTFNQPCLSQDFQPLTRRSRVISYLSWCWWWWSLVHRSWDPDTKHNGDLYPIFSTHFLSQKPSLLKQRTH